MTGGSPIWSSIQRVAGSHAAAVAVRGASGPGLSYAGLIAEVERAARVLRASGSRRPGLLADNGIDWIVSDLACLTLGLPCVPLPGFFSDAQLAHAASSAGLDAVLTDDPDRAGRVLDLRRDAGTRVRGLSLLRGAPGTGPALPAQVRKLSFTSGTTGSPRAVCLPERSLRAVCGSLAQVTGARPGDLHLCLLPLSILLENVGGVYRTLTTGGSVVAPPLADVGLHGSSELEPGVLRAALRRVRPASAIAMPEMLRALTGDAAAALGAGRWMRFLGVGGARVPVPWLRDARTAGIPAYEGYGLSEAGSVVALNSPGHDAPGSAGELLPHCEARVDPTGQLHVRGALALGYLGVDGFSPLPGDEGFYPTGDLARLEGSRVYIEGRCCRRIVTTFGRNVSPEWLETELLEHPEIRHATVSGDGRASLSAVLSGDPGALCRIDAHVRELNRRLPDYARITEWRLAGPGASTTGETDALS